MDLAVFFTGFVIGALFVLIPVLIIKKMTGMHNAEALDNMKLYFENTAHKVLQDNSSTFSNQTEEKLEEFFKRFKDKIEYFEKKNDENFKLEAEKFTRFDENIKTFLEAGNRISKDTSNLVSVMKSDNRTQGHWGEIVLEKVLESSGLRKDIEYKIQTSTAEGRPDATVFLPENRCVFIDAKTSLASWNNFVNAETEEDKNEYLKEFVASTKAHISGLTKREYFNNELSPDYVLMFIPIEGCYSLMFCDNCELWDLAWRNKIMPVSPSTLLAALKIINSFYIVDRQNKNYEEISRLCTGMVDKFSALLSDIIKSRSVLDSALKKLQGKGNILNQIDKIQKLGVVKSKDIPEIPEDLTEEDSAQVS
ncbi:DNA recombination protein RmuC [bacterium]|nr:DNA recombination protein RmuC [bacterium]